MKKTFTQLLSVALLIFGLQTANAQEQIFTVNSPSSLSNFYEFGQAAAPDWGGALGVGESLTGDLAIAYSDTTGGASPTVVCTPATNPEDLAGKIALIDRGACFFSDKVYFAQEAGAIGAIICNNAPGAGVINLGAGGDYAGLDTIPSGMLSYDDCLTLKEAVAAGTVNATISVQEFIDVTAAANYQTPLSCVRPISPSATIFNTDTTTVDVAITWAITDPSGTTTNVVGVGNVNNTGAIIVSDETYTPTQLGEYSVVATNDINDFVLNTSFIITEDVFSNDNNGDIVAGAGPANSGFVDTYGQRYDIGMLFSTADLDDAYDHVESFTFGLSNWEEINANAASSVDFTVVIYQAPLDDMGQVPNIENSTTYDDFGAPLAFAIYPATGNEANNELINVEFAAPLALAANSSYYIFLQYSGENVGNGVAPQYSFSGNPQFYPFNSTPLVLDQFYSGWTSSPGFVLRTYLGSGTNGTSDVLASDAVKLTPNPASTELNIALDLENVSSEVSVQIIDVMARTVAYNTYNNLAQANLSFDVSNYAAGTYFVQIVTEEGTAIKKFVKK